MRVVAGFMIALVSLSGCADPRSRARAAHETTDSIIAPTANLEQDEYDRLAQVARSATESIVHVHAERRPGSSGAAALSRNEGDTSAAASGRGGTGFIIHEAGLVLTNEHVVRGAARIVVRLADGRRALVREWTVDPREDLAVLLIAFPCPGRLPVVTDHQPSPGIVAVGWRNEDQPPEARIGRMTHPMVSLQSALDPAGNRDYAELIETTARIDPGFSGGPLLNGRGELIGVNVAVRKSNGVGPARSYAIGLNPARRQSVNQMASWLLANRHP